jgi:hypothetical protein
MQTTTISRKCSLGTTLKMKLFDTVNHIIDNPPEAELKELYQTDKFTFKYNNKNFNGSIEIPHTKEYFIDYYRTFGTPSTFGLYYYNKATDNHTIIGGVSLILRHDNKVWQIMDLKIDNKFRGKGYINTLISGTLTTRIMKSTAYYAISMNPNTRLDAVCNSIQLPKMKNRGKVYIYVVSYENIKKILSKLETFYCSEIGFIDNNDDRVFIDSTTPHMKMLHLHHNATYREFDYREPKRGYNYCFAIHEENEFMITTLKNENKIDPCCNATIYSNNFKADWSKFVKTFEI